MRIITLLLACVFAWCISINSIEAQEQPQEPKEDHTYKPLKLSLNAEGTKYIRFIMWHQIWATTDNLSDDSNLQLSTSIRRSRFLAFAQVSPRFMILTHFGLNSLSPANLSSLGSNSNSPQLFLHGAWAEYKLHDNLYIGGGLHYWKGMTRFSNASTLNMATLDQSRPFNSWHSLGITDQFARHLGVYLKGAAGKFEYRLAVNNPMRNPLGGGADYSGKFYDDGINKSDLAYTGALTPTADGNRTGNTIVEGYFKYNIWDNESTKLPYYVGTYLGKKKVLSVGLGFFAHPNGMYNLVSNEHSNVMHFAADVYMDMPTSGGALHAYATYQNFNYGDNYVSRWGGTGSAIYAELGYYASSVKLMPYVGYSTSNYQGITDPIGALNAGVNYFIHGHNCKLTAEYHRITNDYREGAITVGGVTDISQIRVQFHVFL